FTVLPTRAPAAETAGEFVRQGRCRPRPDGVQREGEVFDVSRAAVVYGAWMECPHGGGNWHRRFPGEPVARQALPHDALARPVRADERRLLPRRSIRGSPCGDRSLSVRVEIQPD